MAMTFFPKRKGSSQDILNAWRPGDSEFDLFKRLRTAIISEYEQQGRCELVSTKLSELRGNHTDNLNVIAYAALQAVRSFFWTGNPRKYYPSEPVPHLDDVNEVIWWNRAGSLSYPVSRAYYEAIDVLGRTYYHSRTAGADGQSRPDAETEIPIHRTRRSDFDIPVDDGSDTPVRVPGFRTEQPEEAAAIVAQAKRDAERIIEQAKNDAAKITETARTDAARTIADVKTEALQLAEQMKQKVEADRKDAEAKGDRLVREYIEERQREFKAECNAETERRLREGLEQTKHGELLHKEMCRKTDEMHEAFVKTAEDLIRRLDSTKNDFSDHLRAWQRSLYPRELKPIANTFADLYRVVNVDRLICEEVLFQAQDGKDGAAPAPSPATLDRLQRLNRSLTILLRDFEKALNGLDLIVFYPQKGDTFDSYRHICEDEEEELAAGKIKSCVKPGVAKRSADGTPEDVVIPAMVRLYKEGEKE